MKKISRLARVVCLFTVLAMLLSSCDILNQFIGKAPDDGVHDMCLDENLDHLCDECGKPLSECADQSGDHKCDTCKRVISSCTVSENHCCISCGATTSVCIDEDKNHGCDICNAPLSKCADGDSDHKCDVCSKPLSTCTDTNDNHACDVCSKPLSECEDGDRDHKCDKCGKVCSECIDETLDHECEICGANLGDCYDADRDHLCDLCSANLGECLDSNLDHKCDTCDKALGECINVDGDHFCDICKVKLTNCIDYDNDHVCEICGQTISICVDNDRDHSCDTCSKVLSYCLDTVPSDHKCDKCAKVLSECSYVDRVCTVCGESTLYKHVVIIGVDGAGSFFKDTDTPNMDKIFSDGAITYTGITESPSISAECWASLMHGVNASVHGINANLTTPYPNDSEFPSFFRVIRENDPGAVLGSYTTWQTINNIIVEDGMGITKVGWSGTDADLTVKICNYVKSSAPTALYVQFDNVDAAGHTYGFGTEAHLNKITETDALIGKIYDAYTERGIIDDTLFIVTTDHGGTQVPSGSYQGNHGGETAAEKQITFAAKGKTVVKGGTIEDFEIRDTAAIVLHALGYEQPETWTARVPSGLFEGVSATDRPVWNQPETPDKNATPKPGDDGYVTNYITDKNLITYLTFDGNCDDVCGTSTTVNKTITYQDGYFGKGVSLNAGYITLDDFKAGTDSFTVTMWVKTSGIQGDPVLLGNKDWKDSGTNPGIILALHDPVAGYKENNYFIANLADGTTRVDLRPDLPLDFKDGYFHVAVIFDRENSKLSVVFNFITVYTMDIPVALKNATAESLLPLNLGQDGMGSYTSPLNATVDEFMIFDGAFTTANLEALERYYGQREEVEETPDVSDSVTKEIITHLTFDRTTEDATGNYDTTPTKNPIYGEGYVGEAMQLNGNSVTVKDLELGTGSITFSTWVYISGTNGGDPALFGNKDWNSGNNAGILVCPHTNGTLIVNFSDGTSAGRVDLKPSYPTDMYNRWMHLLIVIDKEACEMRVSFDFGDFISTPLGENNRSTPLDGSYDLVIGQDGTTSYKSNGNVYLKGYVDDFIIFSGAFNADDVAALEEYYKR